MEVNDVDRIANRLVKKYARHCHDNGLPMPPIKDLSFYVCLGCMTGAVSEIVGGPIVIGVKCPDCSDTHTSSSYDHWIDLVKTEQERKKRS